MLVNLIIYELKNRWRSFLRLATIYSISQILLLLLAIIIENYVATHSLPGLYTQPKLFTLGTINLIRTLDINDFLVIALCFWGITGNFVQYDKSFNSKKSTFDFMIPSQNWKKIMAKVISSIIYSVLYFVTAFLPMLLALSVNSKTSPLHLENYSRQINIIVSNVHIYKSMAVFSYANQFFWVLITLSSILFAFYFVRTFMFVSVRNKWISSLLSYLCFTIVIGSIFNFFPHIYSHSKGSLFLFGSSENLPIFAAVVLLVGSIGFLGTTNLLDNKYEIL